jgi:hypothetical protein
MLLTKDMCRAVGIDPLTPGSVMKSTNDTLPVYLHPMAWHQAGGR